MAPCHLPTTTSTTSTDHLSSNCQFWQTDVDDDPVVHDSSCAERDVEDASCVLQTDLFTDDNPEATSSCSNNSSGGATAVDNSDQSSDTHSTVQNSSASNDGKTLFVVFVCCDTLSDIAIVTVI